MWDFLQENGEKLLMLAVEAVGIFIMWKRTSKTTPEQKQQAKKQKQEAREEAKAEKLLAKAKIHGEKAKALREVNNANGNEKQNA